MTVSPNAELRPPPSEGLGPRRLRAAAAAAAAAAFDAAVDDDADEVDDVDVSVVWRFEDDFLCSLDDDEDEVEEVLVVCAEPEVEANLADVWLSCSLCMCSAA